MAKMVPRTPHGGPRAAPRESKRSTSYIDNYPSRVLLGPGDPPEDKILVPKGCRTARTGEPEAEDLTRRGDGEFIEMLHLFW